MKNLILSGDSNVVVKTILGGYIVDASKSTTDGRVTVNGLDLAFAAGQKYKVVGAEKGILVTTNVEDL